MARLMCGQGVTKSTIRYKYHNTRGDWLNHGLHFGEIHFEPNIPHMSLKFTKGVRFGKLGQESGMLGQ